MIEKKMRKEIEINTQIKRFQFKEKKEKERKK